MVGLEPHPSCGFIAETYRRPLKIPANALSEAYDGDRPYGSALHCLVTSDAQIVIHQIRSDQLYYHLGDPLEVLLFCTDGGDLGRPIVRNCLYRANPYTFYALRGEPTNPWSRAQSGPAWRPPTSSTGTSRP
jgi:hypothetical protein